MPEIAGFGWNNAAKRYYELDSGRFVSRATLRDSLEALMDTSALNMNALTTKLIDGGISLADWQTGMMSEIKSAHVAASALSQGGWAQMTQSDWGATGQMIREQYDFLRNFAGQIASGEQPLDGRALVRSDLYGDAANGTFEAMKRRMMTNDGYDQERRVLESGADHCDGCLDQAAQGWQPIGTLDAIGEEECQVRCRCEFEYQRSNEAEEIIE